MATLSKGDHVVTTSIPAEATQLRAKGYVELLEELENSDATAIDASDEPEVVVPVVEEAPKPRRSKKATESN